MCRDDFTWSKVDSTGSVEGKLGPDPGPELIANAPLLLGAPQFRVGIQNAPPNSAGFLAFSTAPANGPIVWIGGTGLVLFPVATDENGWATFVPPPRPSQLAGVTFYAQGWFAGEFTGRAEWTAE